jgi:chromosome segregation ATPase
MICLDGKRESSKSCNDGQVLTDRQLAFIDQRLCDTGGIIGTCRRDLNEFRCKFTSLQRRCTAYEHAYHHEKQRNIQSSQAYQTVCAQYEKALNDLAEIANKYRSLQKDFDSAQTTILAQQSVVQECHRRLASQASLEPKIGEAETKTEQLQAKITELEKEKIDMQNALANATDFILNSERKRSEIERINRAVQPQETELSPVEESISIDKRKRDDEDKNEEEPKQHDVPAKKGRKRKHVR